MPTVARAIGLAADPIVAPDKGFLVDIIVQNLSANNVEVGTAQELAIGGGIRIVANGYWANDRRSEPVWLIAAGAGSDCRIHYEIYRAGER